LGVSGIILRDYPDGALDEVCSDRLAREVTDAAAATHATGLLVFDTSGVTGHSDHTSASTAAVFAAAGLDLPVLGWTLPASVAVALNRELGTTFTGHPRTAIDIELSVSRARQVAASAAHVSQAIPGSVLWRRLELLGDTEHLRWLHRPTVGAAPGRPTSVAVPR
jgi:LmbE family N-acetylglucosaminyl deacetylase